MLPSATNCVHVVPSDLLQALVAETPQPAVIASRDYHGGSESFDIDAFIQRQGLEVDGPESWNGQQGRGRRWMFRRSPMCEHHDGAAFIVQHASGAITAECHHNSCRWTWQDLRQRLEPREARPVNGPNVDRKAQHAGPGKRRLSVRPITSPRAHAPRDCGRIDTARHSDQGGQDHMEPRDGPENRQPGSVAGDPAFRELLNGLREQSAEQIERLADWIHDHADEDEHDQDQNTENP